MSSPVPPETASILRDPRAISLLMTASLAVMAAAAISPALPGLAARFASHPDAAFLTRLLVPAPALAIVLFASMAGWIADRFGRRWPMLIGLALFSLAGSAGLYLPDLNLILVSRFVLGIGMALIMTAETALVGDYFTGPRRSVFTGWQIAATNFGGFLFIALASWFAGFSPRLAFAVYLLPALYIPYVWYAIKPSSVVSQAASLPAGEARPERALWQVLVLGIALLTLLSVMGFFVMPTQFPFFAAGLGYEAASTTGLALGALTLVGGGGCAGQWMAVAADRHQRYAGAGLRVDGRRILAAGAGAKSGNGPCGCCRSRCRVFDASAWLHSADPECCPGAAAGICLRDADNRDVSWTVPVTGCLQSADCKFWLRCDICGNSRAVPGCDDCGRPVAGRILSSGRSCPTAATGGVSRLRQADIDMQ